MVVVSAVRKDEGEAFSIKNGKSDALHVVGIFQGSRAVIERRAFAMKLRLQLFLPYRLMFAFFIWPLLLNSSFIRAIHKLFA